mgnify:CR=1 FL=1
MDIRKDAGMTIRLIGSLLIILGCGGFGFAMSAAYKKEERSLRQLVKILDYLSCELQYRLTPLPQLCRQAALECSGALNKIFLSFADELDMQLSADAEICMRAVLSKHDDIPKHTREFILLLGHSLGRFDLEGQLKELEHVRQECQARLHKMTNQKDSRLRTYQTLGLCAGAALAILMI